MTSIKLILSIFLMTLFGLHTTAQQQVQGIVADSVSHQPLPFATVQASNKKVSVLADINGRFRITLPGSVTHLTFSYTGHKQRTVHLDNLQHADTIFLAPAGTELSEFIVAPIQDKIRRIVNLAVAHRQEHNPEYYNFYQCNVYYKMHADLEGVGNDSDVFFQRDKYLLLSETYSRRIYRRPQQLQETIIASRFSGLQKTYFTNMITDVLPFHIYTTYITLNDRDYVNPIAAGWQQRYRFRLEDELTMGNDTVYVLSFMPRKGVAFNALLGTVYINTNGFAISHMVAATADTASDRQVRFEQIYTLVGGRWFPLELNYDFTIHHFFTPGATLSWNGHSMIDSVSFNPVPSSAFDKAHPLKLADSIDVHTTEDWAHYRKDSLSAIEQHTYAYLDSFVRANNLERLVTLMGRLSVGRLPVGKLDVDINRLIISNDYEGTRLGIGLYTNDKISRYYSIGGWAGYGLDDHVWKYGASATIYPNGKKENWLSLAYRKDYDNPGNVMLHEDLQTNLRAWLLGRVDQVEEYAATANVQLGYWELRPAYKWGNALPLYTSTFQVNNKIISSFQHREGSLGLRYAYGEKRFPVFDYYEPADTKYPIAYLQAAIGSITAADYAAPYYRLLAAVTYAHHANQWGRDNFRIDGGLLRTNNTQPLPQSYLLAGNGFNTSRFNFYEPNGLITMRPYDYYTDRYISFYYRHDFDRFLWNLSWSRPFISLAHNLAYGSLQDNNVKANPGMQTLARGYHETGLMLNQLLRINLHVADVYGLGGLFYHWNSEHDFGRNSTFVFGISLGL